MRILLVSYNFPPIASPQAIRWFYLTAEIVRLGVEVHVLAPRVRAFGPALPVPEGVIVHRSEAGGLAGWLAGRGAPAGRGKADSGVAAAPGAPSGLNWKGRLFRLVDRAIGLYCYPDDRAQWFGPGVRELGNALASVEPDIVVSSHEPPVSLQLGLRIADRVPVWMVDMGDPVLAPYTPWRWRRRAMRLEREVCQRAAAITVTTERTRELLIARHGLPAEKVHVFTQGFDGRLLGVDRARPHRSGSLLHLFYAGRFYPFRTPKPLLEAVSELPDIKLTISSPEVTPEHLAIARKSCGRIVFLGEQPHQEVLRMQQEADVLVNIGNALDAQVPGKLYEYLGSGRPILHLSAGAGDPVGELVAKWGWGWSCDNTIGEIREMLDYLAADFQRLDESLPRREELIAEFGWHALAKRYIGILDDLLDRRVG